MNRSSKMIGSLTSLRAVAALMVFLHHYPFLPTGDSRFFKIFEFQGSTGVSLFFVLSGFLIHRSYHDKLRMSWKSISEYFVNRFARIYPMYFLILFLSLTFVDVLQPDKAIRNIFLLKGFSSVYIFEGVATAWTLTTEETFYFLFPIILFLTKKATDLIKLNLAAYALGGLLLWLGVTIQYEGYFGNLQFVMNYTFFGRAFEFFIGIYASMLVLNESSFIHKIKYQTYFSTLLTLVTYLLMTFLVYQNNDKGFQFVMTSNDIGQFTHHFILPIGFAFLITGLTLEKTFIRKILDNRFLQFLGKSSYIVYLLQGGWFIYIYEQFSYQPSNLQIYVAMNTVALILYFLIEEPLNKEIKALRLN